MMPGQPGGGPFDQDRPGATSGNDRSGSWSIDPARGQVIPRTPISETFSRPGQSDPKRRRGQSANGAGYPPRDSERPPWEDDNLDYEGWDLDSALHESIPGVGTDDLTGTGKFNVVVPLKPGESAWGKGISAPRRPIGGSGRSPGGAAAAAAMPAGVEVDAQPSVRMRALRPGNLARATMIVSVAIMISRVLGLFRTSFFAAVFGASPAASAFTYAFTLPDTIFNIVAGGALASAFIPVFTNYLVERNDRRTAWHVASAALNLSTLVLMIIAAICIIFADPILHVFMPDVFIAQAPGQPPLGPQVVTLTQVMLLQPIFLGAATLGVAVLQARQSFLLPAVGQVIYTVGLIGGILATYIDNHTGVFGGHLGIMGPTWGVVAGGALQLLVQIPGLVTAKMQYQLTFDLFHPGVRQMFRMMGPRIFNAAASYAAILITTNWLAGIDPSGVNGVGYGYRTAFTLMLLPLGLFGMAVAQASFPTLAALVSDRQWNRLRGTIMTTLRGMIYLAIPSALGLAVLANPISELILAHGNFDPSKVPVVAIPLIYFSFGLVGLAADEILVRSFYALQDSRTPVYVNICNLMFVLGLSYILVGPMGAGGLALAFALGAVFEAPILVLLLSPRIGGMDLKGLSIFLLNVLAASLVTALAALFVFTLTGLVLRQSTSGVVNTVYLAVRLGAGILVASVVYYLFSRFLGIDDAVPLERIFGRLRRMVHA
ncbi:MAG TPA: murein biosynthesis integral membrane protein MurJ [Ktedonobacterales bacterium]